MISEDPDDWENKMKKTTYHYFEEKTCSQYREGPLTPLLLEYLPQVVSSPRDIHVYYVPAEILDRQLWPISKTVGELQK